MTNKPKQDKRKRGRPVKYVMLNRLTATPAQLAKAVLFTPPKKPHEWKFMQDFGGNIKDIEG